MSWYFEKTGRAGKFAEVVKQQIIDTQGCPNGSAEEAAKNQLAEVVETLCKSLPADKVVRVKANGSAWNNPDGTAGSQSMQVEFVTLGEFIE